MSAVTPQQMFPAAPLFDPAVERLWLQCMPAPRPSADEARAWLSAHAEPPSGSPAHVLAHLVVAYGELRTGPIGLGVEQMRAAEHGLERLVDAPDSPTVARLQALIACLRCVHAWIARDFDGGRLHAEQSLARRDCLTVFDQVVLRFWRATIVMGHGEAADAFEDFFFGYDELAEHHPALFALLQVNLGALLTHAGDYESAERCFRLALANEGGVRREGFRVVVRSNLAYCCINTGRHREARQLIDEAMGIDRAFLFRQHPGDLYATIAENLVETGYTAEAENYLADLMREALARAFGLGQGSAWYCRARLAELAGRPPQALSAAAAALLHLRHAAHLTHGWKAMLLASRVYDRQGDHRRALKWYRRHHRALQRWDAHSRPVRMAYAQQRIELDKTRRQRDQLTAERNQLSQALRELEQAHRALQLHSERIEALQREMHEQSIRDALTGLLNRREWMRRLLKLCDDTPETEQLSAVAMIDLDDFKPINDRLGHLAGDRALHRAARLLERHAGPQALVGRFGGDELCVAFRQLSAAEIGRRLEAFAGALRDPDHASDAADTAAAGDDETAGVPSARSATASAASRMPRLSASIGVALWGVDGTEGLALISAADSALDRSKAEGKGLLRFAEHARLAARDQPGADEPPPG
jgi:GGDEF domain-containing protein